VVIVTLLDRQSLSESYINKIVTNREDYAKRHGKLGFYPICSSSNQSYLGLSLTYWVNTGYTNFFASVSDYDEAIGDAPRSWALIPAMRHAMATHPKSKYFFHLSPHALIMNPTTSLKSHLLDRSRLESLMLKNVPIVPPDSIIKTFALKQKDVDLILTQDSEDLTPSSFILKNGDFARFFLDLWFEPLFRSYRFAKAETHGLVRLLAS
jgi:mannan polymerase II complex MNN11 subunit